MLVQLLLLDHPGISELKKPQLPILVAEVSRVDDAVAGKHLVALCHDVPCAEPHRLDKLALV